MTERLKIAIVGTGISSLAAAYLLHRHHDITVFDKNDRVGGHSNTVPLPEGGGVDSGFIVYNKWTYPNLIRLFEHLGVPTEPSDMSFSVCLDKGRLQYAGQSLGTIFAQRRNLFSPRFWDMLIDLVRFYRGGKKFLRHHQDSKLTLGQYLEANDYGDAFIHDHLLPMAAAIWSGPDKDMLDFPLISFLRFCDNHGLLNLVDRPVWRTVTGGSREYVARLTRKFRDRIKLSEPVTHLVRGENGVTVKTSEKIYFFDAAVIGAHADEALKMLEDATDDEKSILGAFHSSDNTAYVHRDASLMPPLKSVWSSWNYIHNKKGGKLFLTYWMNRLQKFLPSNRDIFVTLNPPAPPKDIIATAHYTHPCFNRQTLAAQKTLHKIQGTNRTWFCGAWTGYGFHEDGAASGIAVAEKLGAALPWKPVAIEKSPARRHTIGDA